MSDDAELELFRASVNCAAVPESMSKGWKLDARQSTRRALKYRRGEGEILIINHDGRGWWDPLSEAKGDVFNLVQHLDPSLNFGRVRRVLRRMVAVAPSCPAAPRNEKGRGIIRPIPERWNRRPRLRRGSSAWQYLTGSRALAAALVDDASTQDAIREGPHGSACVARTAWPGGSGRSWSSTGLTRSTSPPAAAWDPARSRHCRRSSPNSAPPRRRRRQCRRREYRRRPPRRPSRCARWRGGRAVHPAAAAERSRFQRRAEEGEGPMKPAHAWVLLPSGRRLSLILTRPPGPTAISPLVCRGPTAGPVTRVGSCRSPSPNTTSRRWPCVAPPGC